MWLGTILRYHSWACLAIILQTFATATSMMELLDPSPGSSLRFIPNVPLFVVFTYVGPGSEVCFQLMLDGNPEAVVCLSAWVVGKDVGGKRRLEYYAQRTLLPGTHKIGVQYFHPSGERIEEVHFHLPSGCRYLLSSLQLCSSAMLLGSLFCAHIS